MRDPVLASLALIIECCVQAGLASQQRRFHWDKRKRAYVQLQSGEQVKAGKRMRVESGALVAGKAQPSGMYQRWSRATQLRVAAPGDLEDPSAKPHANLADRYTCLWINLGCVGCMLAMQSLIKHQGGGGLLCHACVLRGVHCMRLPLVLGSAVMLGGGFSLCEFHGAERGCLKQVLEGRARVEEPSQGREAKHPGAK